jgi:hypothetical protein
VSTSQAERGQRALDRALELVVIVRDYGRDEITTWLRRRSRLDLEGIAVALAALVPEDSTPRDLLAWMDEPPRVREPYRPLPAEPRPPRELAPCGTRAAHERHKIRGEKPCDACNEAQRAYHAARYIDSRQAQEARAAGRARRAS